MSVEAPVKLNPSWILPRSPLPTNIIDIESILSANDPKIEKNEQGSFVWRIAASLRALGISGPRKWINYQYQGENCLYQSSQEVKRGLVREEKQAENIAAKIQSLAKGIKRQFWPLVRHSSELKDYQKKALAELRARGERQLRNAQRKGLSRKQAQAYYQGGKELLEVYHEFCPENPVESFLSKEERKVMSFFQERCKRQLAQANREQKANNPNLAEKHRQEAKRLLKRWEEAWQGLKERKAQGKDKTADDILKNIGLKTPKELLYRPEPFFLVLYQLDSSANEPSIPVDVYLGKVKSWGFDRQEISATLCHLCQISQTNNQIKHQPVPLQKNGVGFRSKLTTVTARIPFKQRCLFPLVA